MKQADPHRLWEAVQRVHDWFESHGHPARERFGVSVTPEGRHHWLGHPGQPVPSVIGTRE